MMRTAVARRALQVALLVGGLFALGFLCGEQAHAAEETPVTSARPTGPLGAVDGVRADGLRSGGVRTSGLRTDGGRADRLRADGVRASGPAGLPPTDPATTLPSGFAGRPSIGVTPDAPSGRAAPSPLTLPGAGDQVLGAVVGGHVQGVGGRVLQPVGGLVVVVADALGEVTAQIPPLSSLPALPVVPTQPGAPSLPGVPGLPSFPSQPGLPTGQGQTSPPPVAQPGDGAGQPVKGGGVADGRSGAGAGRGTTYGPMPRAGAGAAHASGHGGGQRSDVPGYVPVHQAPGGDPTGELSSRNAVDSGTSRHGDAYAVALDQRAPSRLLAGAAARAVGGSTRDRHRDVPVSPA
nr:hypothetical protein [Streptomyces sp. CME 23]